MGVDSRTSSKHVADVRSRQRLQSSSSSALIVPATRRVTIGSRAFPVAAAWPAWNVLPESVTAAALSIAVFRRALKTHLFSALTPTLVTHVISELCIVVLQCFGACTTLILLCWWCSWWLLSSSSPSIRLVDYAHFPRFFWFVCPIICRHWIIVKIVAKMVMSFVETAVPGLRFRIFLLSALVICGKALFTVGVYVSIISSSMGEDSQRQQHAALGLVLSPHWRDRENNFLFWY